MKKDKKTAEFIRDKLVDLINTEYNRYEATIDDHTILVNAIHDIYNLYTPDKGYNNKVLQEYLSNVIANRHVMVNYPPKDDEFIYIKDNNEISLLNEINYKLNDYINYDVYYLNYFDSICIKLSDEYKFIFTRREEKRDSYNTYFIRGNVIIPYKDETSAYFIHEKLFKKIQDILNDNPHRIEKFCVRDTTSKILHSMECEKKITNDHPNEEPWIYDKNLILDDDTYYIFRVETDHLSDNDKFTILTTWRNICYSNYKFIAFQKYPLNPKYDFVQPKAN